MAQWIDVGYGVEKLELGIVTIQVYWAIVAKGEPTGYQYSFGPYKSKRRYSSMDEAKEAALTNVDKRLEDARREITTVRVVRIEGEE